jgi:uncharacterized damage-inducible protein DinB/predicted RNase H-like HicB family nuclease
MAGDEWWFVNLEHGERWWYAHVVELPGCFTREDDREEALIALPGAISRHLEYLRSKGVKRGWAASGLRVVEEVDGIPELGEAGGAVALFGSDRAPVSGAEFRPFLELMRWNREELMSIVESLSENARTARPLPGKWAINETLRHIANAEEWYISRLGLKAQREYEAFIETMKPDKKRQPILDRLYTTRQGVYHVLDVSFEGGVPRVFKRSAYTKHPEEEWTFRKVLRRFVEHEREHIGTIKKVIDALPADT